MKSMKKFVAAIVMVMSVAIPAAAQFRFGVKAGVAVNSLSGDLILTSANRAGFTGGAMAEFTVPIIGVGADVSLLYVNRSVNADHMDDKGLTVNTTSSRSYIDLPLNIKYKLSLPAISSIVCPFVTTGPDFSFLVSKENIEGALTNKKFDFGWNFGLGVELIKHLQVAASYGIGISQSVSGDDALLNGKNRCWTITAAWLF